MEEEEEIADEGFDYEAQRLIDQGNDIDEVMKRTRPQRSKSTTQGPYLLKLKLIVTDTSWFRLTPLMLNRLVVKTVPQPYGLMHTGLLFGTSCHLICFLVLFVLLSSSFACHLLFLHISNICRRQDNGLVQQLPCVA